MVSLGLPRASNLKGGFKYSALGYYYLDSLGIVQQNAFVVIQVWKVILHVMQVEVHPKVYLSMDLNLGTL